MALLFAGLALFVCVICMWRNELRDAEYVKQMNCVRSGRWPKPHEWR